MAKQSAFALAPAAGATILQTPTGGKRLVIAGQVKDFCSWLALWSFLYQLRKDQIDAEARRAARDVPSAVPVPIRPDYRGPLPPAAQVIG